MSTASLLRWIALVAGGELAARGYLANRVALCHAGAALFALALAALWWPTRAWRAGIALGGALLALTAVDAVLALSAEPAPRSEATRPFDCERPVAGRLVVVDAPALVPIAPRASPLGGAIEAWLRAPDADVSAAIARTREAALAARRAGADVALVIPAEPRALAYGLRSVAGAYAIPAIEAGELEAVLAERRCR